MIKRVMLIGGCLALVVGALLAYAFFKTPEEASAPIAAIPIVISTPASAGQQSTVALPTAANDATAEVWPAQAAQPLIFEIAQEGSEARFMIDEVLEGAPKRVVGSTSQVAGQIALDPLNPALSQVGTIQVNARTLSTDNDFRNRAIKNRILLTNDYEYVTFVPRQLIGLPQAGSVGQTYSFQMVGDLTITDITREVTFEINVTATSESALSGLAAATIRYDDFKLFIPQSPLVSKVEDTVRLELEFVAHPSAQQAAR